MYFLEWLAHSGVASRLIRADFYHAMIVNEKVLAAIKTVLEACQETVEELVLAFGPEVDFTSREYASATTDWRSC